MAKQVTAEQMKVLADALEEFGERMSESFILDDFHVSLGTSSDPNHNLQITARLHPEDADQFVMEFE